MSFRNSWGFKQHYCYTCGNVFLEDEGMLVKLRDRAELFFCDKHFHKIPSHIPDEQERRWYDALRKKSIQSDGEKREQGSMG
jgi:hypothetical protein